jgi:hypothetical protein
MATPAKRGRPSRHIATTENPVEIPPTLSEVILDHTLLPWKGEQTVAQIIRIHGRKAFSYKLSNGAELIYVPPGHATDNDNAPYSPSDSPVTFTPADLQSNLSLPIKQSTVPVRPLSHSLPLPQQTSQREVITLDSDTD